MADEPTALETWTKRLARNWGALVQAGVAIVATIGTFALAPPALQGSGDPYLGFGRFLVAILAGIAFILARKRSRKKDSQFWVIATVASLAIASAGFVIYQVEAERRTCPCLVNGKVHQVVMGTVLTTWAEQLQKEEPSTCCQLLASFGHKEADVWTADSLARARRTLGLLYLMVVAGSAMAIMSVTQAVDCASRKKT
jgi:uncharacterized membrane protein HdeD (DUF308 family)